MRSTIAALLLAAGCLGDPGQPIDTGGMADGPKTAISGESLFVLACASCHGVDGRGGSSGPDLAQRTAGLTTADIADVVLFGSGFMDPVPLDATDADAVARYVSELVAPGR